MLFRSAQLCPHRLHVARCSCGAFTASTNFIRMLGGQDQTNGYLSSVELVSVTSVQILSDSFSLSVPMACFGVATIADNVYLFGGKSNDGTLPGVYVAPLSYFQ